eukprot:1788452-Rhodomonas_salina.1
MDEDENKHHGNDDLSPAGRRRPRKGIPKRSPFDNDSWNDELAESVRYPSTSDAECCADEDERVSPCDFGNDCYAEGSDTTQPRLDAVGCNSVQHLGNSEGMVTCDTILAGPTLDCASSASAVATGMADFEWGPAQMQMSSGGRQVSWSFSTQEPGTRAAADGGERASKSKNCRKHRQRVAPD